MPRARADLLCVLAVGLLAPATVAAVTNPNYNAQYTSHATLLRSALLANYDKGAPPTSTRAVDYSEAGTDVQLNLRIYKLEGVEMSTGRIDVALRSVERPEDVHHELPVTC